MYEDVKIENIGPKESRRRMFFGLLVFAVTIVILGVMMATDISRWWRLALFIPFSMAALGFIQSTRKTCVVLATQGACNFDRGEEPISDENVRALLLARSRTIRIQSMLAGLILTFATIALPV
ncbi:MAG: hypothetical protein GF404_00890 [candidate division Zixibacteria bacterium]|jgi:hypothetical protein|nr:hypothetical protein [candidate division Zixibacteria bacterium]